MNKKLVINKDHKKGIIHNMILNSFRIISLKGHIKLSKNILKDSLLSSKAIVLNTNVSTLPTIHYIPTDFSNKVSYLGKSYRYVTLENNFDIYNNNLDYVSFSYVKNGKTCRDNFTNYDMIFSLNNFVLLGIYFSNTLDHCSSNNFDIFNFRNLLKDEGFSKEEEKLRSYIMDNCVIYINPIVYEQFQYSRFKTFVKKFIKQVNSIYDNPFIIDNIEYKKFYNLFLKDRNTVKYTKKEIVNNITNLLK